MSNDMSPDVQSAWRNQERESFRVSTEDIRRSITKLESTMRKRTRGGLLVCAAVMVGCIWWMTLFEDPVAISGAIMTMIGVAIMAYQIYDNRMREQIAARQAMGNVATIDFHRAQLERQRDFHRGHIFWTRMATFVPGPIVFMIGFIRSQPHLATFLYLELLMFVLLGIAAVPLNLRFARKYQRQIDALDRLQKEKP